MDWAEWSAMRAMVLVSRASDRPVDLGGLDQAVDGGGAVAALVRAREQPVPSAEDDAAQRALCRIVAVILSLESAIYRVSSDQRVSASRIATARSERRASLGPVASSHL